MKKGDFIRIVPNDKHQQIVRNHYGKRLVITNVVTDYEGNELFKIHKIPNYALKQDLELIAD